MEQKSFDIPLVLMFTVLSRKHDKQAVDLFTDEGVLYQLVLLGHGTASTEMREYLGLGEAEKVVFMHVLPRPLAQAITQKLSEEFHLNKPGNGITFTIPIDCVCGISALRCFTDESKREREACTGKMSQYDLIVAVTNRGYSGEVMEAAKTAGATGGTILNARGGNLKNAETFLGIPIQPEKELVLIVTDEKKKAEIMQKITADTGVGTKARSIVFSLPINGIEGLTELTGE